MDGRWDTPDLDAAPDRDRGEPAGARARVLRQRRRSARSAAPPRARAQHAPAGTAKHRRALRSRQRLLPAVARPDDDLLGGAVRWRPHARSRSGRSRTPSTTASSPSSVCAPGAHVLEIGCGWGGFAQTAARAGLPRDRAHAVATRRPRMRAQRIAQAGLADRVAVPHPRLPRRAGRYDDVVSIEMFEAVGESAGGRPTSPRCAMRSLAAGARASRRSRSPTTGSSATGTHRFHPAVHLPRRHARLAVALRRRRAARAGLVARRSDRRSAPTTPRRCGRWLAAFDSTADDVRAQGFDERFIRCWRFYLAYCAAGFTTETTDVGQYTFVARVASHSRRPRHRARASRSATPAP